MANITWVDSSVSLGVGSTASVVFFGVDVPDDTTLDSLLGGYATASSSANQVVFTGVAPGTVTIPSGSTVETSVTTSNALTITVTGQLEDESYLNKRGLAHFWENIDDIKQDKMEAMTNAEILSIYNGNRS